MSRRSVPSPALHIMAVLALLCCTTYADSSSSSTTPTHHIRKTRTITTTSTLTRTSSGDPIFAFPGTVVTRLGRTTTVRPRPQWRPARRPVELLERMVPREGLPEHQEYLKHLSKHDPQGLHSPVWPYPDDFYKFIPIYQTSIPATGQSTSWAGQQCFQDNSATLSLQGTTATLTLKLDKPRSLTCLDLYLFASLSAFHAQEFFTRGEHKIVFKDLTPTDIEDLKINGFRIFLFNGGILSQVVNVWETLLLFLQGNIPIGSPTISKAEAEINLKFLKDHMNITMPPRSITDVSLPESQVHSGDFFAIMRLDGLDPMVAYGMGAHTGHTAVALRINGTLYVCESTVNSHYWPTNGIQKTPYAQWIKQAKEADYNVVHLPLSPANQKIFNESSAGEFFAQTEGLPYGFHNFLFGWLDTVKDNLPPPLTPELVPVLFSFLDRLSPATADLMWNSPMNKRLGTTGLNTAQIYDKIYQMNKTVMDVVIMPEQDSWTYQNAAPFKDGPAMVCNVFVCHIYKAAGLFGSLAQDINCGETTNWDVYSMNLFDANYTRPQQCVTADPDSQFCQLLGKYRMALPGYNSVTPYAHMSEHCGALPPEYKRLPGC